MSTEQGREKAPGQAPAQVPVEPSRQVRLTRKMREAIQYLQEVVGTDREAYARSRAHKALSGDNENWYKMKHNRLKRRRRAAKLARAARRVKRGSRKAGGGGARPRRDLATFELH